MKTFSVRLRIRSVVWLLLAFTVVSGCKAFPSAAQQEALDMLRILQQRDADIDRQEQNVKQFRTETESDISDRDLAQMLTREGDWRKAGFLCVAIFGREGMLPTQLSESYFTWLLRESEARALSDEKERAINKYPESAFRAFLHSLKCEYTPSWGGSEMEDIEWTVKLFESRVPALLNILADSVVNLRDRQLIQKYCLVLETLLSPDREISLGFSQTMIPILFSFLDICYPAAETNSFNRLLEAIQLLSGASSYTDQPIPVLKTLVSLEHVGSEENANRSLMSYILPFIHNPNPAVRLMVIDLTEAICATTGDLSAFRALSPRIEDDPDSRIKTYYKQALKEYEKEQ